MLGATGNAVASGRDSSSDRISPTRRESLSKLAAPSFPYPETCLKHGSEIGVSFFEF